MYNRKKKDSISSIYDYQDNSNTEFIFHYFILKV